MSVSRSPTDTERLEANKAHACSRAKHYDEAVGEEHEFEIAFALGELETLDERAARREREAREASGEWDIERADGDDR